MGFEGANVLFDTWVHPLMMGLEEHLIGMFRGDAEFHQDAAPSHLGGAVVRQRDAAIPAANTPPESERQASLAIQTAAQTAALEVAALWGADAEKELRKIPFFVRGKARRNTEIYARELNLSVITIETLYDAKAHFSR